MTDKSLRQLLEAAARILAGGNSSDEPPVAIAPRRDGAPAAAFLVCIHWAGRPIGLDSPHRVLALRLGRNLIGRKPPCADHEIPPRGDRLPLFEPGQWVIEIEPSRALVRDAWASNSSSIVRAGVPIADDERQPILVRGATSPKRVVIAHANTHPEAIPLEPGDTLVGTYASFLFGRL